MAIDLNNAVSDKMKDRVNAKDNKPTSEPGFEDGVDFSSLFDSLDSVDSGGGSGGFGDGGSGGFDDFFGGGGDSGFGGGDAGFGGGGNGGFGGGGTGGFGDSGFGGGGGFGANTFGGGTGFGGFNIGGQMGMGQQQAPAEPKKKDAFDSALDFTSDALKASGNIAKSLLNSIKTRNYDDYVSVMIDWLILGGSSIVISLLLKLIGKMSSIGAFGSIGSTIMTSGFVVVALGALGFGISSLGVLSDKNVDKHIKDMDDIPIEVGDAVINDDGLEDMYASLLDDFTADLEGIDSGTSSSGTDDFGFGGDDFGFGGDDFGSDTSSSSNKDDIFDMASNEDKVKAIAANNPRIDRKFLVETLGAFFPENAKGFSDVQKLEPGNNEYDTIRVLTLQAVADAAKMNVEELSCDIISIESSLFCYVIVCERQKGVAKTDDLKREIESNFRQDAEDVSVSATINIEHGNYKIVITKGADDVVTLADCLNLSEVKNYMLDTKKELPFIAGVDAYGKPVLADGKNYTTMLIAGKPRSGKSWYVNSIMASMLSFNTPEDIQVLLIDPKKSNLFKTMSCLPHVIGLHDGKNMVQIMQEIIDVEGERRKELLNQYRCDNIWDLRKRKNVKLPVLLIVIDEYMTLMGNLSQVGLDKEFTELFNMAITQLPFVGIHFLFVPHRAQGVVSKITRSMIMFTAAIRADDEIVKETLDVKRWDRPLSKPGDTALKLADEGIVKYVRAAAMTTSDTDNMLLLEDLCRAWYKMGVDIPKKNGMEISYNRDENEIADILGINASDVTHIQYSDDDMYGSSSSASRSSRSSGSEKASDFFKDFDDEPVKSRTSSVRSNNRRNIVDDGFGNEVDSSELFGGQSKEEIDEKREAARLARKQKEAEEDAEVLDIVNAVLEDDRQQQASGSSDDEDGWLDGLTADNLWDDE